MASGMGWGVGWKSKGLKAQLYPRSLHYLLYVIIFILWFSLFTQCPFTCLNRPVTVTASVGRPQVPADFVTAPFLLISLGWNHINKLSHFIISSPEFIIVLGHYWLGLGFSLGLGLRLPQLFLFEPILNIYTGIT